VVHAAGAVSSDEVISDHMVVYGSVEELQVQNQRLLRTVRELAADKERFIQKQVSKNAVPAKSGFI